MKVVAILYKGGEAAKQEPRLLGTVENEVSYHVSSVPLVTFHSPTLIARFALLVGVARS